MVQIRSTNAAAISAVPQVLPGRTFPAAHGGLSLAALAMGVLVGGMSPIAGAQSLTGLGVLPGHYVSNGESVSADGSVVVGASLDGNSQRWEAFRWTAAGGMTSLGFLPGQTESWGTAVNADGSVVVGWSDVPGHNPFAFRWTSGGGMTSLGMGLYGYTAVANAVSADGSVVAGIVWQQDRGYPLPTAAWLWNFGDGPSGSVVEPAGAYGVSADGSVVVGNGYRWTAAGGATDIGSLSPGGFTHARGVSGDGSVVVGQSDASGGAFQNNSAFRWTAGGGMVRLERGEAYAANTDGSVVVGYSEYQGAFFWTNARGVVVLNDYLPTLGIDLSGWSLFLAHGVSADGRTIVGTGQHNGQNEAWIVTLPCVLPPTLAAQPQSESTCPFGTVSFSVAAAGSDPLTYQWQVADPAVAGGWANIANGSSIWNGDAVAHFTSGEPYRCQFELFFDTYEEGRSVRCVVTNTCGSTTSDAATLTVNSPPSFSLQPSAAATCPTGSATLSVVANGTAPLTYQWQWREAGEPDYRVVMPGPNGVPGLPARFTVLVADQAGIDIREMTTGLDVECRCVVTNTCGSLTSDAATLTVCAADFDCSGDVAVPDIFSFLSAWFAQDPAADFDGVPGIAVPDIFAFLSAWFAGCP